MNNQLTTTNGGDAIESVELVYSASSIVNQNTDEDDDDDNDNEDNKNEQDDEETMIYKQTTDEQENTEAEARTNPKLQPVTQQQSTSVYGTHHYFTTTAANQPIGPSMVSLSAISTATTTTTSSSAVSLGPQLHPYGRHHNHHHNHNPKQCVSFAQPVDEWSCESVAQWLAINDLAAYIDSFLDKSINGEKLIGMDTSKLKVKII